MLKVKEPNLSQRSKFIVYEQQRHQISGNRFFKRSFKNFIMDFARNCVELNWH